MRKLISEINTSIKNTLKIPVEIDVTIPCELITGSADDKS